MSSQSVVILMGSRKDLTFAAPIGHVLEDFSIDYEYRIASAHKTPEDLVRILKKYEQSGEQIVYITVAGMSNALSGLVDANTKYPVIACPPYSESFGGADIFSSLRMPSGVASLTVLNPKSAALGAAKILALGSSSLSEKIREFQLKKKKDLGVANGEVKRKRISELERGMKR